MNIACIRHSQIPGASRLFIDLLYHFDRVESLYPYAPDLTRAHESAKRIDMAADHRRALVEALRPRNTNGGAATQANLERLSRPETVVVATGQQVIASVPDEPVVTCSAGQFIVAAVSGNRIVAAEI